MKALGTMSSGALDGDLGDDRAPTSPTWRSRSGLNRDRPLLAVALPLELPRRGLVDLMAAAGLWTGGHDQGGRRSGPAAVREAAPVPTATTAELVINPLSRR